MASLKRIILINSHLPGVVELNLDGHTNICGTNASGKTTLQRLLPIFYGEYPSRVVPATRDSFERWYLPTQASYIIYEYLNNEQQLCQVVLAPAIEGKGVNYRCVHRGFELEDYIYNQPIKKSDQLNNGTSKQLKCMTMAELRRALKQSGVAHTRLLNTKEFRAIIQNDRSLINTGKNKNDLHLFARQFSLCDTGQTLRHIEKLTRAVHSKEGKMETIKAMIAAILEEDGVATPAYNLDPKKVDNWISESKLVQGFEAMRPDFDKLESENQQLFSCEKQIIGLNDGYQRDRSIQWQHQEQNKDVLLELKEKEQFLDKNWDSQRDELKNELSATKADIRSTEKELDQIEEQYSRYLDKNIDQMKQQLEQLPSWKDELDSLNDQLRLMLAEHQDLEVDYQKRLNTINKKLNQSLQMLDQGKDQLIAEQKDKLNQKNETIAEFEKQFFQRRQQLIDSFNQQKSEIQLRQKELQVYIDNVHYTSEEQLQLDVFENRINQVNEEIEIVRQKLDEFKEREFSQKKKVDLADQQLSKATQTLLQCQQETEKLNQFLNPKKNSLLDSLRKENPGWEMNLGKVINPELLQRSDLKPDYTNKTETTFYGLNLDLSNIELPEYAQAEKQYVQQLNQAEEKEQEAHNFQIEARQTLDSANSVLNELKKELALASTEYKKQKNNYAHIIEEKQSQKRELDAALRERKDELRKKVTLINKQLEQLTETFAVSKDKLQQDSAEERIEMTAHWQEVIQTIDERMIKHKEKMITRRGQAKTDQKSCEQWHQQQCKERGIDQQKLNTLESQQEELQTKITSTEQSRDEVLNYNIWYQQKWLERKPEQQQHLTKDRTRLEKLTQQFSTQEQCYKEERTNTQKAKKQAQINLTQAESFLQRINFLLNKIKPLRLTGDGEQAMGEISERLRKGEDLLLEREKLLDGVKHYIEHFDALIAKQSGSSLAETWERSREEFTLFNEQGIRQLNHRKLVEPLSIILNKMVPQSIHALREQGRNFGIELNGFYDVLANIDRKITSQSNRITKEVDEDLSLDGVSNSAVRIRSRISELDFWPELKAFVTAFDEWRDEGFKRMPNESYINSIRRAIDIIGRSAFTGGVSGLLEIELHLREGNSDLIIRTDRQLNESSSHGMAYMILCKFLLAFTRLLRNKADVTIHWPIDELGTLHHDNIKKIFDACKNNNIQILGAFPNPDSAVLNLFTNRYIIDKQTKELQTVKPRLNLITEKIKQHQAVQEAQ